MLRVPVSHVSESKLARLFLLLLFFLLLLLSTTLDCVWPSKSKLYCTGFQLISDFFAVCILTLTQPLRGSGRERKPQLKFNCKTNFPSSKIETPPPEPLSSPSSRRLNQLPTLSAPLPPASPTNGGKNNELLHLNSRLAWFYIIHVRPNSPCQLASPQPAHWCAP